MNDAVPPADDDQKRLQEQISHRLDELWGAGTIPSEQTEVGINQQVAHFKIRRILGSGAFGVVYLADDTIENRPVALKLPRLEVLCNPRKRDRFIAEANVVVGLDHPGIVEVYKSDMEGPMPYIATAWCNGGDLGQWNKRRIAEGRDLPSWQESAELIADVAEAVHFAHEQGVTHRDLKPANILLTRKKEGPPPASLGEYRAQITDFGLAKLSDPAIVNSRSSVMVGTPVYMAPEKLLGGSDKLQINPAAEDIYALGAMLFEMLVGKLPVEGDTFFEVLSNLQTKPSVRIGKFRKDLPSAIKKICNTCLKKNPIARYDSAAQLADDLRKALAGERIVGNPVKLNLRAGFWFKRQNCFGIAGWFAIVSQSIVTLWLMLCDFLKVPFGILTQSQYLEMLPDLIFIALTTSVSVILAGFSV